MQQNLRYLLFFLLIFAASVQAAPGEFWELTMSMEGMGMAMPARTSKECLPMKDEGQPAGVDKSCKITDLKPIPNGSTWKMNCNDGTSGSGTQTRIKDTITSDILMNTRDGSMKMSMKGKRVGGSCDTEAKTKALMADAQKSCDLSDKKAYEVVGAAALYTAKDALCAGKKEQYCSLVKRELPIDIKTYDSLNTVLKADTSSTIVQSCGLNVEGARQSLCKANASNRKEQGFLDKNCPAETKLLRDKMRQEECAGRQFTAASDNAKCLAGMDSSGGANESSETNSASAKNSTGKSDNPAMDAVKEGTKTLKGLKDAFGF
jgi:hypothetical protein